MKFINLLSKMFKYNNNIVEEQPAILYPKFDKKYKIIVIVDYNAENYYEIIEWLNLNTKKSVVIKSLEGKLDKSFIAFENNDDAIFFKLKFGV